LEEPAPPFEPEAELEREPAPVPPAKPAAKPAAAPVPVAAETELEPTDHVTASAEAEASSAVEATEPFDLEASLSAYSAAVQQTPRAGVPLKSGEEPPASEPAEDFGHSERTPGAGEAENWADPPVEEAHEEEAIGPDPLAAPTTEHGLATLLDDLVAQNLSGLEDAFAKIDRNSPAAEPSAGGRKKEAVSVH
jgi:hypothetical protein